MSTPYPPTPEPRQPDPQQPYGQQPYGGVPSGSPAPVDPGTYGSYGPGAPAPAPGTGLAVAGLVTAIVPCTTLVGLALSIVALVKANRGTAGGRGMAIAGIVVAAVWLIGGAVAIALGIGTLVETCAELGTGVHHVDGVTYTCNV